jgi:hypothetical protein
VLDHQTQNLGAPLYEPIGRFRLLISKGKWGLFPQRGPTALAEGTGHVWYEAQRVPCGRERSHRGLDGG